MLLAAVLAAEGVSFVLVGSAALSLHGDRIPVSDIDAVLAPDEANLAKLRAALGVLMRHDGIPSLRSLASADVISVRTGYGTLDCLLRRGRQDWHRLRGSAQLFEVAGTSVTVACAADVRVLRRRFKG